MSEHDRKKALFRLQTHLKEERFLKSFVEEDGVQVLLEVLDSVTGNSLAYALSCFQAILESREPLPTSISIDAILKQVCFRRCLYINILTIKDDVDYE